MSSRIFNELDVIELKEIETHKHKYELGEGVNVKANQLFIGKIKDKNDDEEILGLFLYIDGDVRSVSFDDTTYGFVKNEIEYVNSLLSKLQFPYDEKSNESEEYKKYDKRLDNFVDDSDGDTND